MLKRTILSVHEDDAEPEVGTRVCVCSSHREDIVIFGEVAETGEYLEELDPNEEYRHMDCVVEIKGGVLGENEASFAFIAEEGNPSLEGGL